MLNILLQFVSYIIAFLIPYVMLTGPVKPHFCYPLYSIPILALTYFSGPMAAAGMLILAIVVGIGGLIFSIGDLNEGIPFIFLIQAGWLYFLFWIAGKMLENKDLKIHRMEEEVEKLEIRITEAKTEKKELEESCHGLKERIAKYNQLRFFTDSLASTLHIQEVKNETQKLIQKLFDGDDKIDVQLHIFPSFNSPEPTDSVGEWIVKHRIPLHISDLSKDTRFLRQNSPKTGSLLCAPIEIEQSIAGILSIQSLSLRHWEDGDLRFFSDIANIISLAVSNAIYYEQTESLAVRDSLTGLYVRYRFNERIEEEFFRAKQNNLPLSLIIFDIDHFKNVNDTHGHPSGDEVLKTISQIMMAQTRETDFCSRYGGEEIAILMPLTKSENAFQIAERIRQKVGSTSVGDKRIRVTISGGVASVSSLTPTVQSLIETADRSLYDAKEAGRNRVIVTA